MLARMLAQMLALTLMLALSCFKLQTSHKDSRSARTLLLSLRLACAKRGVQIRLPLFWSLRVRVREHPSNRAAVELHPAELSCRMADRDPVSP